MLHADETTQYTSTPEQEWGRLADEINLATLPGSFHAMLVEPGVRALHTLLLEGTRLSDGMAGDPGHVSSEEPSVVGSTPPAEYPIFDA